MDNHNEVQRLDDKYIYRKLKHDSAIIHQNTHINNIFLITAW